MINLCTVAPLYVGKEPEPTEGSRSYRALLLNVNTQTGKPDKVATAILQLGPDLIVLEEVNDRWLSVLSNALRAYPHSKVMSREDNFGIAL